MEISRFFQDSDMSLCAHLNQLWKINSKLRTGFFFFCILLFEPQYKIKAIAEESHTVLDKSHMLLEQEYL